MIASGLARAAGRRLALVQSASLQACAASVDNHQAACSARGVTKAARKAREANLKAGMAEMRWPAIAPGSRPTGVVSDPPRLTPYRNLGRRMVSDPEGLTPTRRYRRPARGAGARGWRCGAAGW